MTPPSCELVDGPATPFLSVVVPAYNEARRLRSNVGKILDYLEKSGRSHEVLVVDDGSTDDTQECIRDWRRPRLRLLAHEQNLGKGAAVRTGVLASRGHWVLITDADLSTPIEELEKLLAAAGGADLLFASRAVPGSRIETRQPRRRERLGRAFNLLVRTLRLTDLRDTQCGFKLLRGQVARDLFTRLRLPRYAFDVELAWRARRNGYRVREVGVRWCDSGRSAVRPWIDGTRMVLDVIALRLHAREPESPPRDAPRLHSGRKGSAR